MAQKSNGGSVFPWGNVNNPRPVNASAQPKGTIFGAPTPMKKAPMKMSAMKKAAVKKKKVGNAASKLMFGGK